MAINSLKKIMKTIGNMKCIVMVIFSYILWGWGLYQKGWILVFFPLNCVSGCHGECFK